MSGFGFFAFVVFLVVYIGVPLAVIFFLKWTYQIKNNSDLKVKLDKEKIAQNKEIIQLLKRLDG